MNLRTNKLTFTSYFHCCWERRPLKVIYVDLKPLDISHVLQFPFGVCSFLFLTADHEMSLMRKMEVVEVVKDLLTLFSSGLQLNVSYIYTSYTCGQ